MKNWSIDNKLWLCVLSPSLLCCIVLAFVFTTTYFRQLDQAFVTRGEMTSQNVIDLISGLDTDRETITAVLEQQLAKNTDLHSIVLTDTDRNLVIEQGQKLNSDFVPTPVLTTAPHHIVGKRNSYFQTLVQNNRGSDLIVILAIDRTPLQLQKFQITLRLALVAGLVFLTAILTFAFLKRLLVRPFILLRDNLERLSHGEDTKVPADNYGQPFDLLFNYIKRTGDLIDTSRRELQETVEQATSDLRETLETVEEQNIELSLARKQALAANKAKSEFLSNTSHEIRTPINGILGFVQLLMKGDISDQQRDYLCNIEKSSQGLLTTINSILDVSKIETGQLVLDYNPFNLKETIQDCIGMFITAATAKNLQLKATIDNDIPVQLLGDALRLKQVLCNLLGNAIKFSNQGTINISVSRLESNSNNDQNKVVLMFRIEDQGPGIDPKHQRNLFELFSQLDNSNSREQGGAGLGLAICKGLVELMNGDIGVESTDHGATFWFQVKFGIDQTANTLSQINTSSTTEKPQFKGEVLAVDDTPANLQLIATLLKDLGLTVHQADNGMEALGFCERINFDLIFMDIQMPVIDGMETTRRIRRMEQPPHRTPIVALTAHAMTDQKTDLLLAGLDDYLSKPISESQLLHILRRWLNDSAIAAEENIEADPIDTTNSLNSSPVDIGLSLQLSNNKPDLARDMLSMLLKDLPAQRQSIVTAQEQEDFETLETIVHKIRGGASYCGVPNLKTTSSHADELLRKKEYQETAIVSMLDDIDQLLAWAEEVDLDVLFGLDTVS